MPKNGAKMTTIIFSSTQNFDGNKNIKILIYYDNISSILQQYQEDSNFVYIIVFEG